MAETNGLRVLSLTAENVKRLSVVEIKPTGDVVVLAGDNEAGKSSVLDAVAMALGGKALIPAKPIRDGQTSAKVRVDLGDYIVTRTFTAAGGGSLTVTNRDGAKFPNPQTMLDGLVGPLSFDPLAFAAQKPADQATTLRALAKIDTTDIELARKAAFEQRTLVNRDLAQASGALAKMVEHKGVGTEPETFDALTAQLDAADELAKAAANAERHVTLTSSQQKAAGERASRASARCEELRRALEAAETEEEAALMASTVAEDAYYAALDKAKAAQAAVPDRSELRKQIAAITERNQHVIDNQARARMAAQVAEHQAESDALTRQIAALDSQKADALTSARFPIAGLGLDDTGVTWQGLPFAQASTAVRTRVACAIGMALHSTLRVMLIRNGNDLDGKSLQVVAEMAAAAGVQVWVERIAGGNGQQTIVIEDGEVAQ